MHRWCISVDSSGIAIRRIDGFVFTDPTVGLAMDEIGAFLRGLGAAGDLDRTLAAVLFTDIIGSTEKAAAIGDQRWRQLVETHDAVARSVVELVLAPREVVVQRREGRPGEPTNTPIALLGDGRTPNFPIGPSVIRC